MTWIDTLGYTAGIMTLINMMPQILKTYKTKSAKDISSLMVITYVLSMLLWVIYAYFIVSWPIIITNGIAFMMGTIELILMLKYKRSEHR